MKAALFAALFGIALRAAALFLAGMTTFRVMELLVAGLLLDVIGQLLFGRTKHAAIARAALLVTALSLAVDKLGGVWYRFVAGTVVQEILLFGVFSYVARTSDGADYLRRMAVVDDEDEQEAGPVLMEEPRATAREEKKA